MRRGSMSVVAAVLLLAACRRREEGTFVTAPFNDATRIAKVEATWVERPGGFRFEAQVENRLADRLYVRLGDFSLLGAGGQRIATSDLTRACVVPPHETRLVLSGEVTVAGQQEGGVTAFAVESFGVPLSERGRGIYREFLLQQQMRTAASIDEEIESYMTTPACD